MRRVKAFLHKRTRSKTSESEISDWTPPDPQNEESYTMKLPTELLIAIFSLLGRNSEELVSITAVCRRWRTIAIQTPDLWTKITIVVNILTTYPMPTHKSLNRIRLFLKRTKDLPLDVEWHDSQNPGSVPAFLELFRRNGPFCRWRSLTLSLARNAPLPLEELRETDSFSSLKSLTFPRAPPFAYLDHISKTLTRKLHILELGVNFNISSEYRRILGQIDSLRLSAGVRLLADLRLPLNITTIYAGTLPALSIPNIRHLFVNAVDFELLSTSNPVNLVSLGIFTLVQVYFNSPTITLPNLQWLKIKGNAYPALNFLKVPSLHTLSIEHRTARTQNIGGPLITALCNRFEAPKLLILLVEFHMDDGATRKILRTFPLISRVDLTYHDAESANKALFRLFPPARDPTMCPNLDFLRVTLDTRPDHRWTWAKFVRDTAVYIGDPLWRFESIWPGGSCFSQIGVGEEQKTPLIYPWREGDNRYDSRNRDG